MKKLLIYGIHNSGKTTAVHKIIKGKKTITCTPIESAEEIIRKIQCEQFDYVVFEEANGFSKSFLTELLNHDTILNQSENSTLIIIVQSSVLSEGTETPIILEYREQCIKKEMFAQLKPIVV